MRHAMFLPLALILSAPASAVEGKVGRNADATIRASVLEPRKLEFTEGRAKDMLKAPQGFVVSVFVEGLVNPRMLATGEGGAVYVTRRSVGDVVMLKDENGDGKADVLKTVASRPGMHGIFVKNDMAYLAAGKDVYTARIAPDGSFTDLKRIMNDLPDLGQHPNRTLAIGPDGMLYISVGSTANAHDEANDESATILRATPDGTMRTIFASGLRNTIGFAWHPKTGALYGMDHGIDWLGDNEQIEELNLIQEGKQYGWPYIYGEQKINPQDDPPEGMSFEQLRETSEAPLLGYKPHAAPMQMVFYAGGQFPKEYEGDAFVAMRGSWNARPPAGYEVVRIRFKDGKPVAFEPFLTGFLIKENEGNGFGYLGRPVGLAVTEDGSLLVSDDSNGVIYRVAYDGKKEPGTTAAVTQSGSAAAPDTPVGKSAKPASDIAIKLVEPTSGASLDVSSPTIRPNAAIPLAYSAYGDDASPPLAWTGTPNGTKVFAIIIDDPDAPTKPFTHWIVYNLPPDLNMLREGLPPTPVLQYPKGVLQGRNSRGSIGYTGMKPPPGDPPHHYHIQVFALDRALDLKPGATREEVLDAMKGRVLAEGELVGTFSRN